MGISKLYPTADEAEGKTAVYMSEDSNGFYFSYDPDGDERIPEELWQDIIMKVFLSDGCIKWCGTTINLCKFIYISMSGDTLYMSATWARGFNQFYTINANTPNDNSEAYFARYFS